MGPEVCLSNVLPGEAEEYQGLRWDKEVGVGSVPSSLMNTRYRNIAVRVACLD